MFPDLLQQRLAGLASLTGSQLMQLEAHYELLVRWNKSLNLTTITDLESAVTRHYAEAIFLGLHLPRTPCRIVDIGSGAGFPGFPVGVLRPDCEVVLIESHQRKCVFLKEATRNLPNVRVLAKRSQDVKETFDVGISRAVSYEDLTPTLKRLAADAVLLTGMVPPPESLGWNWEAPIPLPWSPGRFLRLTKP